MFGIENDIIFLILDRLLFTMGVSQVGEKIKFFRERAGLNQYYFEEIIGMSHGSLSRIEKGRTNPTKETIQKISVYLKLSNTELMYLSGVFDSELIDVEIKQAKKEARYVLNDPQSIAYLLDDKRRVLAISKGLKDISGVNEKFIKNVLGINVLELLCVHSEQYTDLFFVKDPKDMLLLQLSRLIYEAPYIFFDEYWLELIAKLLKYPVFREVWDIVNDKDYKLDIFSVESRIVKFSIRGFNVNLIYTEETLQKNQRFKLAVYFSNNNLLDFLKKFQDE